jgi:hypothetical protein
LLFVKCTKGGHCCRRGCGGGITEGVAGASSTRLAVGKSTQGG